MELHNLVFLVLAVLTGFALGGMGSGGSILAMPAFVYAAGLPVKTAVPTSLCVVGATSLVAGILAERRCRRTGCPDQEVDLHAAMLFALGGLFGAYVGARLSRLVVPTMQMALFGVVILAAAAAMALRLRSGCAAVAPIATRQPRARALIPVLGIAVGAITGLVGVGGGFLIVPALTLGAGVPMKRATATSVWVIAINSAAGLLGHLAETRLPWRDAALFFGFSLAGMVAGQRVARVMRPQALQAAFAVFLTAIGIYVVARTACDSRPPGRFPALRRDVGSR